MKDKSRLVKITISDIAYVEAMDNYTVLYTVENKKYVISSTLKSMENKLDPEYFLRIHRGYIVNVENVLSIEDNFVNLGFKHLPIGKSYKKRFMEKIHLL